MFIFDPNQKRNQINYQNCLLFHFDHVGLNDGKRSFVNFSCSACFWSFCSRANSKIAFLNLKHCCSFVFDFLIIINDWYWPFLRVIFKQFQLNEYVWNWLHLKMCQLRFRSNAEMTNFPWTKGFDQNKKSSLQHIHTHISAHELLECP